MCSILEAHCGAELGCVPGPVQRLELGGREWLPSWGVFVWFWGWAREGQVPTVRRAGAWERWSDRVCPEAGGWRFPAYLPV